MLEPVGEIEMAMPAARPHRFVRHRLFDMIEQSGEIRRHVFQRGVQRLRGAQRVYAIDVGTGQLDWRLRNDPRVVVREQVNARYLGPDVVPEPVDLAVCDVSFISVTMILPALEKLLAPNAEMVILVKPQFELEREQVGKGGIIRDPESHQQACRRVADAVHQLGFQSEIIPSPILGAEGNHEFLLYVRH